jgi:hypothetical protein
MLGLMGGCGQKSGSAVPPPGGDSAHAQLSPAPPAIPQALPVLPPPQDSTVTWAEFKTIIRANPDSVRAVMQTHDRQVTATFRSGIRLHATEPDLDDVVAFLRQVDPAGHILIATE